MGYRARGVSFRPTQSRERGAQRTEAGGRGAMRRRAQGLTAERRARRGSGASPRLSPPLLLSRLTLRVPGGEGEARTSGLADGSPPALPRPGVLPPSETSASVITARRESRGCLG